MSGSIGCCDRGQSGDADQVVGCRDQISRKAGPLQTPEARATEATHGLHPAEDLLHPFADTLADAIPRMACCSTIDGTPSPAGVLCHVRRDVALTHVRHELLGVIVLVPAPRLGSKAPLLGLIDLVNRRLPFGGSGGLGHLKVDRQPVPILHHDLPHEDQLGLLALALAEQARVWICRALVGRVRALLTMKVDRGITRIIGWLIRRRLVLGPEALETDRKSTRLNSSHVAISYAVFCLKK